MANAEQVFLRLASKPKTQRSSIIEKTFREYGNIIYAIADDIFNSCIDDYYASYTPEKYKRHGNIEGFNLYRLNNISFDGSKFQLSFDEDFLLKYGTKEDIREEVMNAVFSGQRGTTKRPSPPAKHRWPMAWSTSYPNEFSQYNYWKSKYTTMDEIFYDFVNSVLDDTEDLLWNTMNKYV